MSVDDLIRWCRLRWACSDALVWLATLDPTAPAYRAWQTCPQGDWLLWFAGRVPTVKRTDLVLAACDCAETALRYVPDGEERPRIAIETAQAWCRGEATIEEVRRASYAARATYYNAAAYAASAAYAADDAADVAAAAAAYAADAAAYADRGQAHRHLATLVRRRIRWADVAQGLDGKEAA